MNGDDRKVAHTLGVLEAIEERSDVSQRRIAQRLGVALGLANSYLKRCVRKGWVKVQQVPGNRYLYYLTPKGFAEKSRLSASYLSYSLSFYRKAGESCLASFDACRAQGWKRLVLCGISDLAEIAYVRSQERGIRVVGFVDADAQRQTYLGRPVAINVTETPPADAYLLTDLANPSGAFEQLRQVVDEQRILVPDILEWRPRQVSGIDSDG